MVQEPEAPKTMETTNVVTVVETVVETKTTEEKTLRLQVLQKRKEETNLC